jgi:hypothetical protein
MSSDIRFDSSEVGKLADQLNEAASKLGQGRSALDQAPTMSGQKALFSAQPGWDVFGNTSNAGAVSAAYSGVQGAGSAAAQRFGTALTADVKRIHEVIACFRRTEHKLADQVCAAAGGRLNVFASQVHSSGSDNPANDDSVRAGQLSRLRQVFNNQPGVLGVDGNTEVTQHNQSAAAVRSFNHQGNKIDGGEVGGTSASHKRIDYVITSPGVIPEHAQRVEGSPSDHDGQRVELTPSRW